MALHFIGFRDTAQIDRATQVFGAPDFIHARWDIRAAKGGDTDPAVDVMVFAKGTADDPPSPWSYDDSAAT